MEGMAEVWPAGSSGGGLVCVPFLYFSHCHSLDLECSLKAHMLKSVALLALGEPLRGGAQ